MTSQVATNPVNAEQIRALLPHAGTMCLLERVLEYDAGSIRCDARSHLDPANPLRRHGHLPAICGIEYAAQAMALHGALTQAESGAAPAPTSHASAARDTNGQPGRRGYLISVRNTCCHVPYLDETDTALQVRAKLVFGDATSRIYSFAVTTGQTSLVTGRAAVMLG
ncbi:MAG: 3-hydroxylacyl-ACP dehydratase [Burkholderiales bacterium]|jgi:predicted hotdog family 3-hydroxylacyl-ACP dehydratase